MDDNLSKRELALRWWMRRSTQDKIELAKYTKISTENRDYTTLTGNEIEFIWNNWLNGLIPDLHKS